MLRLVIPHLCLIASLLQCQAGRFLRCLYLVLLLDGLLPGHVLISQGLRVGRVVGVSRLRIGLICKAGLLRVGRVELIKRVLSRRYGVGLPGFLSIEGAGKASLVL